MATTMPAAFLLIPSSAVAPLLRLSCGKMLLMALPCTIVGFIGVR